MLQNFFKGLAPGYYFTYVFKFVSNEKGLALSKKRSVTLQLINRTAWETKEIVRYTKIRSECVRERERKSEREREIGNKSCENPSYFLNVNFCRETKTFESFQLTWSQFYKACVQNFQDLRQVLTK